MCEACFRIYPLPLLVVYLCPDENTREIFYETNNIRRERRGGGPKKGGWGAAKRGVRRGGGHKLPRRAGGARTVDLAARWRAALDSVTWRRDGKRGAMHFLWRAC